MTISGIFTACLGPVCDARCYLVMGSVKLYHLGGSCLPDLSDMRPPECSQVHTEVHLGLNCKNVPVHTQTVQTLWLCGRIGLLPAHSNTNGIPMEKKGHKWPNPVPIYQVKRLDICLHITRALPWLTCILVVMHLSTLCQTLSSSSIHLQALGFLIQPLARILGFQMVFFSIS